MPKKVAVVRSPLTAMMTQNVVDSEGATIYHGSLVVVCDDGAVFSYYWPDGAWSEMPPIPGTAREPIAAREHAKEQAEAKKSIDAGLEAWRKRTAAKRAAK